MPDNAPTPPRRFPSDGRELALAEDYLEREYQERPRAFLELLLAELDPPAGFRLVGDVGVVDVSGPLEQRGGWWWDGYDSIVERAAEAFADPRTSAVVLALDSPGGAAAGNLAAARQLRSLADASGKPFLAHADTIALSAAYALAVAADQVTVTADGAVGSVGVISRVFDRTKANADAGLDVRVVRSGPLKEDPHPDVALTDASVARVRARVNELAAAFAAWVGERRGRTAEEVLREAPDGERAALREAVEAGVREENARWKGKGAVSVAWKELGAHRL
jgi:ClpP class serine protease